MSEVNGKYAPRPGFIPGVAVNFAGNVLVVAPLGLLKSREAETRLKEIAGDAEKMQDFVIDFILYSLLRNYPEITREQLVELLDARSIEEASEAIRGGSGLKLVTVGELPARD